MHEPLFGLAGSLFGTFLFSQSCSDILLDMVFGLDVLEIVCRMNTIFS
jgi:hypothetical protein